MTVDNGSVKSDKICRQHNKGYCKYKRRCRFCHSKEICTEYVEIGKCSNNKCRERHPLKFKWTEEKSVCRRENCAYLHATTASNQRFKCESCLDVWEDRTGVAEHVVNHRTVFFCLNCDDWVQNKNQVFTEGWKLTDDEGFLMHGL